MFMKSFIQIGTPIKELRLHMLDHCSKMKSDSVKLDGNLNMTYVGMMPPCALS